MSEEELKKRKEIVDSLEPYQKKILLKTEIRLFLNGDIDEHQMEQIIAKSSEKNEEARLNRMTALIMTLRKHPDDISNLKAMFDYRCIRIMQGYYLDLLAKDDDINNHEVNLSGLERERVEEELLKTEGKRKDGSSYNGDTRNKKHDKALANFDGLMRDIGNAGYNFGYTIPFVESGEYKKEKMDQNARKEITDWMFQLFEDIEEINILKLKEKLMSIDKDSSMVAKENDTLEDVDKMRELKKELLRHEKTFGGKVKKDDGAFIKE